ncbi:uncharacterized protein K444DRAFT_540439, partial [Hyaloscypha bicolor E]
GWLKFDATVEKLESPLSTEYNIYEHSDTEELHIECDEYHVPVATHPRLDFISPTSHYTNSGSSKPYLKQVYFSSFYTKVIFI